MLRRGAAALAIALATLLVSFASTADARLLSEREGALLRAMNTARAAYALPPLRVDPRLQRAARGHSAAILRNGSFSHGSFAYRLRRHGVRTPLVGENLAWGVGSLASPRAVVRAWLASPGHRANLLRRAFSRVGVGALVGPFAGYARATVVTADFAG